MKKPPKSPKIQKLIDDALVILQSVGIPFEGKTQNGLTKMAVAFLAVSGVTKAWKDAKGQNEDRHLTTKEIIRFINDNYEENISKGSYDDIRRKHLKHLVLADLVLNSAKNPSAAPNDPTRGYTLDAEFKTLITFYGTDQWDIRLKLFNKNRPPLAEILKRKRDTPRIPITLPGGLELQFSKGGHNQLQREVIETFLPIFGNGCSVLYIGDATHRFLHQDETQLSNLGFFGLSQEDLPDIIAYDAQKNWLFLIEAVFSSGPMTEERVLEFKKLLKNCTAELIFVTAFISRAEFKRHAADIAWETEAWTADFPEHLIHFNGHKFLGPYTR